MPVRSGQADLGVKVFVAVILVAVAAVAAAYVIYGSPRRPCCVPEPTKGQLFLESYNFQTSGRTGTLFAVFGVYEGQNVSVTGASLDGMSLTHSNSNLTSSCGTQDYGTWTGYVCRLTVTFGSSLPAPSTGTTHDLTVLTTAGVTSSFQVTAGYLYEATSTAAYPIVGVSGTVYQGCVGSLPLNVSFTDEGGATYTTDVDTTGHAWTYSIVLANGHTYSVSVSYKPTVPNPSTQTASAGKLNLAVESSAYTYNISC